jgi:hypothetical protein
MKAEGDGQRLYFISHFAAGANLSKGWIAVCKLDEIPEGGPPELASVKSVVPSA